MTIPCSTHDHPTHAITAKANMMLVLPAFEPQSLTRRCSRQLVTTESGFLVFIGVVIDLFILSESYRCRSAISSAELIIGGFADDLGSYVDEWAGKQHA